MRWKSVTCNPPLGTCENTDTVLVHRVVCLFTHQLLLVLIAPTHGQVKLICVPGCIPRWLIRLQTALTGPDVEQLYVDQDQRVTTKHVSLWMQSER